MKSMCFNLLVLHEMTKKSQVLEAKRESQKSRVLGTGNVKVDKCGSYYKVERTYSNRD